MGIESAKEKEIKAIMRGHQTGFRAKNTITSKLEPASTGKNNVKKDISKGTGRKGGEAMATSFETRTVLYREREEGVH